MRIESAMLAGREGMIANGQAIAVVGDNIANSNTDGYKTSRIEFADLLSSGPTNATNEVVGPGGTGVQVAAVRTIYEGGTLEPTGRALDCGIDGGGFFLVGDAANPSYTRAGNFSVNGAGQLVNSDGLQVLGYAPGATALSALNLNSVQLTSAATSTASMTGNVDATSSTTTVPPTVDSWKTLRGAETYGSTIDVYDSLGKPHTAWVAMFKTGTNTWSASAYMDGADLTGGTAGTPVRVGGPATMTFSDTGAITTANQAAARLTATPAYAGGAATGNFTVDLSTFTQFASPSSLAGVNQNGQSAGNIQSYEIRKNGELYAVMDSGTYQLVGTIQLGDVTNRDGLERAGKSIFIAGADVGTKMVGAPGKGTYGSLQGGALERSTVDLSSEFIDLVLYQRGYQANSQTMKTSDDMLKQALGMIR